MFSFETPAPFLEPYVSFIYILRENDPKKIRHRLIFPNVGSALTVYHDVNFKELSYQRFVATEEKESYGIVLHINRIEPIEIIENGRQKCVVIVFKPLGINHFLRSTLAELQDGQNPTNINFHGTNAYFLDLAKSIEHVEKDDEKKILIEKFLKESYHDFEYPILYDAVRELGNFENDENLPSITRRIGLGVRTMDRMFREHIGITPVQFRAISKFRASLINKLSSPGDSLHKLAHESNYSDLAYMLKVYKKFTGRSAKLFFNSISADAEGRYVYHEFY